MSAIVGLVVGTASGALPATPNAATLASVGLAAMLSYLLAAGKRP